MPMLWDREISAAQLSMATVGLLRAHGLPIDLQLAPPMEGYSGWGIRVNSLTDDSREEHRRPAGVVLGGLARAVRAARDNSLPLVGYQWKGRYYAPGAQE